MNNYFTKESIKKRILGRMESLWEVRGEECVDPIVKLLIEGLAGEIFKLFGELRLAEGRILERLADVLTPSSMVKANAATAILHCRCREGEYWLNGTEKFYYKRGGGDGYSVYDYRAKLVNGDVRYLIAAGKCSEISCYGGREDIAYAREITPLFNNRLWIGVELDNSVESLKETSFFIDFLGVEYKEKYLRLLSYSRCFVNGEEIKINLVNSFKISNNLIKIESDIRLNDIKRENFPCAITQFFTEEVLKLFAKPIVWIEIELPESISYNILESCTVQINAFPIVNTFTRTVCGEISSTNAIVPLKLKEGEYIVEIERVIDSNGVEYVPLYLNKEERNAKGFYTLRRGGEERFNEADANCYLLRLIDLLYDESVAFAHLNREFLRSNVLALKEQIDILSGKIVGRERRVQLPSYVLVYPIYDKTINLFIDFKLTNGSLANGLVIGDKLSSSNDYDFFLDKITLLTSTYGGADEPSIREKLNRYKYALLSNDSIFTESDILNYCKGFYGDFISAVEVARGYDKGDNPRCGVFETLDVVVRLKQNIPIEAFRGDLLRGLTARSPKGFNYRVILK